MKFFGNKIRQKYLRTFKIHIINLCLKEIEITITCTAMAKLYDHIRQSSEKTNNSIPRKLPERRTDGRKDRKKEEWKVGPKNVNRYHNTKKIFQKRL